MVKQCQTWLSQYKLSEQLLKILSRSVFLVSGSSYHNEMLQLFLPQLIKPLVYCKVQTGGASQPPSVSVKRILQTVDGSLGIECSPRVKRTLQTEDILTESYVTISIIESHKQTNLSII